MNSAVCTLFEKDYHYGVGALVNSLCRHGFRGTVWAGFRGDLPFWAEGAQDCETYSQLCVAEGVFVCFVPLTTSMHLANYKAEFMAHVWNNFTPQAETLFYFDPDITVKGRWQFFENWAKCGIALCEDSVYAHLPSDHPFRADWIKFAERIGHPCRRALSRYYNSGFVGFTREHISALHLWRDLLGGLGEVGVSTQDFKPGDRSNPFFGTDQDVLNIMAMATEHPLSTIGPEGMDFAPGGFTMSHAATTPKPWRKHFMKQALSGFAPTQADKEFLRNCGGPITLYSPMQRKLMALDMRVGAALGRVVRRN